MPGRPPAPTDLDVALRAADEYTGLLWLLTMALLSPLRLAMSGAAFRQLALRLAGWLEGGLMLGFALLLLALAAWCATGFDLARWLGLG